MIIIQLFLLRLLGCKNSFIIIIIEMLIECAINRSVDYEKTILLIDPVALIVLICDATAS